MRWSSPGELDEVESRLDILYRLKKKYGATVEEMLQYLDKCRKELDEIHLLTIPLPGSRKNWTRLERKRIGRQQALSPAAPQGGRKAGKAGPGGTAAAGHAESAFPGGIFPHR